MRVNSTIILLALCPVAQATSLCIEPPIETSYRRSNVVVAATIEGVSTRKIGDSWQQTVLWNVDENWKGRHYKGSQFTTRTKLSEPEKIKTGQSFLLLLRGSEPYEWASCKPGLRRLQDSLQDVPKILKESVSWGLTIRSSRDRFAARLSAVTRTTPPCRAAVRLNSGVRPLGDRGEIK